MRAIFSALIQDDITILWCF